MDNETRIVEIRLKVFDVDIKHLLNTKKVVIDESVKRKDGFTLQIGEKETKITNQGKFVENDLNLFMFLYSILQKQSFSEFIFYSDDYINISKVRSDVALYLNKYSNKIIILQYELSDGTIYNLKLDIVNKELYNGNPIYTSKDIQNDEEKSTIDKINSNDIHCSFYSLDEKGNQVVLPIKENEDLLNKLTYDVYINATKEEIIYDHKASDDFIAISNQILKPLFNSEGVDTEETNKDINIKFISSINKIMNTINDKYKTHKRLKCILHNNKIRFGDDLSYDIYDFEILENHNKRLFFESIKLYKILSFYSNKEDKDIKILFLYMVPEIKVMNYQKGLKPMEVKTTINKILDVIDFSDKL